MKFLVLLVLGSIGKWFYRPFIIWKGYQWFWQPLFGLPTANYWTAFGASALYSLLRYRYEPSVVTTTEEAYQEEMAEIQEDIAEASEEEDNEAIMQLKEYERRVTRARVEHIQFLAEERTKGELLFHLTAFVFMLIARRFATITKR